MTAIVAAPIHRLTVEQLDALVESGMLEDRRMELVDGILFYVFPPIRRIPRPLRSLRATCIATARRA